MLLGDDNMLMNWALNLSKSKVMFEYNGQEISPLDLFSQLSAPLPGTKDRDFSAFRQFISAHEEWGPLYRNILRDVQNGDIVAAYEVGGALCVHAGVRANSSHVVRNNAAETARNLNKALIDIVNGKGEAFGNDFSQALWLRPNAPAGYPDNPKRAIPGTGLKDKPVGFIQIVGHNVTGNGRIKRRFNDQMLLADVGMADYYGGNRGHLEISGREVSAYRLVSDEGNAAKLEALEQEAADIKAEIAAKQAPSADTEETVELSPDDLEETGEWIPPIPQDETEKTGEWIPPIPQDETEDATLELPAEALVELYEPGDQIITRTKTVRVVLEQRENTLVFLTTKNGTERIEELPTEWVNSYITDGNARQIAASPESVRRASEANDLLAQAYKVIEPNYSFLNMIMTTEKLREQIAKTRQEKEQAAKQRAARERLAELKQQRSEALQRIMDIENPATYNWNNYQGIQETGGRVKDGLAYKARKGWDYREVLIFDRRIDPVFRNFLDEARNQVIQIEEERGSPMTDTEKLEFAFTYLNDRLAPDTGDAYADGLKAEKAGRPVLIGDAIIRQVGSCRHKGYLMRFLLQELDVTIEGCRMRRGYAYAGNISGGHLWMEGKVDGVFYVIDPSLEKGPIFPVSVEVAEENGYFARIPEEQDPVEHYRHGNDTIMSRKDIVTVFDNDISLLEPVSSPLQGKPVFFIAGKLGEFFTVRKGDSFEAANGTKHIVLRTRGQNIITLTKEVDTATGQVTEYLQELPAGAYQKALLQYQDDASRGLALITGTGNVLKTDVDAASALLDRALSAKVPASEVFDRPISQLNDAIERHLTPAQPGITASGVFYSLGAIAQKLESLDPNGLTLFNELPYGTWQQQVFDRLSENARLFLSRRLFSGDYVSRAVEAKRDTFIGRDDRESRKNPWTLKDRLRSGELQSQHDQVFAIGENRRITAHGIQSRGIAALMDIILDGRIRSMRKDPLQAGDPKGPHGPFYILTDDSKSKTLSLAGDETALEWQLIANHRGYLVPEETDRGILIDSVREAVRRNLLDQQTADTVIAKILTYDEFIRMDAENPGFLQSAPALAPPLNEALGFNEWETAAFSYTQPVGLAFTNGAVLYLKQTAPGKFMLRDSHGLPFMEIKEGRPVMFGRKAGSAVKFSPGATEISDQHLTLLVQNGVIYLRDTSTHGVRVFTVAPQSEESRRLTREPLLGDSEFLALGRNQKASSLLMGMSELHLRIARRVAWETLQQRKGEPATRADINVELHQEADRQVRQRLQGMGAVLNDPQRLFDVLNEAYTMKRNTHPQKLGMPVLKHMDAHFIDRSVSINEHLQYLGSLLEEQFRVRGISDASLRETIREMAERHLYSRLGVARANNYDVIAEKERILLLEALAKHLGLEGNIDDLIVTNDTMSRTNRVLTHHDFAGALRVSETGEVQGNRAFIKFLADLYSLAGRKDVKPGDVLRTSLFHEYVHRMIHENIAADTIEEIGREIAENSPEFVQRFTEQFGYFNVEEAIAKYYTELFTGNRSGLFPEEVDRTIQRTMENQQVTDAEIGLAESLHQILATDLSVEAATEVDIGEQVSEEERNKRAQINKLKSVAPYVKNRTIRFFESRDVEFDIMAVQAALAQQELEAAGLHEADGPLVADNLLFGSAERGDASLSLAETRHLAALMRRSGVAYSVVEGKGSQAGRDLTRRLARGAQAAANTTSLARWNTIKTLAPVGEDFQPVEEGKTIFDTEKPAALAMVPFLDMLLDLEKAPESPAGKDLWQVSNKAAGLRQSWKNMLAVNKQATMPIPVTGDVSPEAARAALIQDLGFPENQVVFAADIKSPEDAHGKIVLMQFDMAGGMQGLIAGVWNILHPGKPFDEALAQREMVLMMNESIRGRWKEQMPEYTGKYRIAVGEARKGGQLVQAAVPDVFAMGLILASVEEVYEDGKLTADVKNRLRALFTEFFRDYAGEVTEAEQQQVEALLAEIESEGFFHLPPPGRLLQNSIQQYQNERAYIDTAA